MHAIIIALNIKKNYFAVNILKRGEKV